MVARGDMTDVDESAVEKNASFRRIRQSTRCQQKGADETAAVAVGGQQESGCTAHATDACANAQARELLLGHAQGCGDVTRSIAARRCKAETRTLRLGRGIPY